jgi:hypothetical protein
LKIEENEEHKYHRIYALSCVAPLTFHFPRRPRRRFNGRWVEEGTLGMWVCMAQTLLPKTRLGFTSLHIRSAAMYGRPHRGPHYCERM